MFLSCCDPANESSLVDHIKLACALNHMPRTSELKDGCIPVITCSSDPNHLGHWKIEEFAIVKFAQDAPYVLHSITPKPSYGCFFFSSSQNLSVALLNEPLN